MRCRRGRRRRRCLSPPRSSRVCGPDWWRKVRLAPGHRPWQAPAPGLLAPLCAATHPRLGGALPSGRACVSRPLCALCALLCRLTSCSNDCTEAGRSVCFIRLRQAACTHPPSAGAGGRGGANASASHCTAPHCPLPRCARTTFFCARPPSWSAPQNSHIPPNANNLQHYILSALL
jgi:hypothetical protein